MVFSFVILYLGEYSMQWPHPQLFEKRITKHFVFFPVVCGTITVWLERYNLHEEWFEGPRFLRWIVIKREAIPKVEA